MCTFQSPFQVSLFGSESLQEPNVAENYIISQKYEKLDIMPHKRCSAEKRNLKFNRPGGWHGRNRKLIQEKRLFCQLERQESHHNHDSVSDKVDGKWWVLIG